MRHFIDRLRRFFDLRPGELGRVGLSFLLLGLIIMTSYILKPVRNSLFLSQFGAQRLPYAYIAVAVVAGVAAAGLAGIIARWQLRNVFVGAALLFAASLAAFWWAVQAEWPFTGFVLYVWVSIYSIVLPSLFWLTANYVFYSNEARRVFSTVGAGGILGAIAGGSLTSSLVPLTGTPGLLLAAAILLIGVAATAAVVHRRETPRIEERRYDLRRQKMRHLARTKESGFRLVARSTYLKLITMLTVVTIVSSTLVDYQFNAVAEASFRTTDELTGFFGTFFASLNVLAFVLQLLVAGRLLNQWGIGAGLAVLPLALLSASVGFMVLPGLLTAAWLKASDDGLSNSVNRSSVEILWIPISLEVKHRAKAWLDLFVDRLSRGIAGGILLFATAVASLPPERLGGVVMVAVSCWLGLTVLLKREYLKAFRFSLSRRDIDVAALTDAVQDQHGLSVLRQALSGSDEQQMLYALELLQGTNDEGLVEPIKKLATHPRAPVRAAALRVLSRYDEPPLREDQARLIEDGSPQVSAAAIELLAKVDPSRARQRVAEVFRSGETSRLHALLSEMEIWPEPLQALLSEDLLRRFHRSPVAEEREIVARAAGYLPMTAELVEWLSTLLADPSARVARAAAASAGRLRHERFVPMLMDQLKRRPLRRTARHALARYGPSLLRRIAQFLDEPEKDVALRRALPQVLAELDDQRVVSRILSHLPDADPVVHFQAIRALGKMRARFPHLRFARPEVNRLLEAEGRTYARLAANRAAVDAQSEHEAVLSLLLRALEERLELIQEQIFRLLGLIYPPDDIFNAWNRLVHGRPPTRSSALEFLGNLLDRRHKSTLLPLLEPSSWEEVTTRAQELYAHRLPTLEETLVSLVTGTDAWLAACAVTLAGILKAPVTRKTIEEAGRHADPVVRQAATATLRRLGV